MSETAQNPSFYVDSSAIMLAPASNGPTCRRNMDPFSRFFNDINITEKGTHPIVQ